MLKVGDLIRLRNTNKCLWGGSLRDGLFLVVSKCNNNRYLVFNKNRIFAIPFVGKEAEEQEVYKVVC